MPGGRRRRRRGGADAAASPFTRRRLPSSCRPSSRSCADGHHPVLAPGELATSRIQRAVGPLPVAVCAGKLGPHAQGAGAVCPVGDCVTIGPTWRLSSHRRWTRTWRAPPLFRGVSFKLERGDRMTLAGRNGAGKTTLLRMLAGADARSMAASSSSRRAPGSPCTTSARRASSGLTLRDYVLAGCADLVALEQRLRDLEAEMAARPEDSALLERYAKAQARLEHAGGWDWRAQALGPAARPGFGDDDSGPGAPTLLRAASSPAPRSPGRSPAIPTCCCSTSPPTTSTSPRSSGSRATSPGSTPP